MKEINWYALDEPKPCEMCGKLGRHTTIVGEVLCDNCAIILNKSKFLTTAENFFRETLWGFFLKRVIEE